MRNKLTIIMFGLLIAVGWTNALAQQQPTVSPAQRLALTVVDNVSVYDPVEQTNTYINTLQLTQPGNDNPYKLTAGMLNNGDNIITISRQGMKDGVNEGSPVDVASINLSAEIHKPNANPQEITRLEFGDYSTGNITLQSPWASNGLTNASSGARIRGGSNYYIRYTIPQGYDNGIFILNILTNSTGTFRILGQTATVSQAGWVSYNLTGLNSGGQITIQGPTSTTQYSPYMVRLYIEWLPLDMMPSYKVTPSITNGNGDTTTGTQITYTPNDYINLSAIGTITDKFTVSTEDNEHPDAYNYATNFNADVEFPSGSEVPNFYASVDFTTTQYADPATSEIVGEGEWAFPGSSIYMVDNDGHSGCLMDESFGKIIFYLPNSFAGHQVNVTVSSCVAYGAGDLYVNGVSHTFTNGSSYTWTVETSANGIIMFEKPSSETYSIAFEKIVISSGNGSALGAPRHENNDQSVNMTKSTKKSVKNDKVLYSISKR